MGDSILQILMLLLAGCAAGAAAGWLIATAIANRRVERLKTEANTRIKGLTRERDLFANKFSKARSSIEPLQAKVAKERKALESTLQKSKVLAKNVLALRTEREETKARITTLQKSLISVKQQTLTLQREFEKAGDFYKGELAKSFDKRKSLEKEVGHLRIEHQSLASLVESAVLEHGSPKEMITEAHLRLGQLDVLQRNVEKLEKENQRLRDDAVNMKRDYDGLQKDLKQLDELKIYNKQLVDCVESLESSRQHSEDASETLRLKLEDLEKNFADIEEQQNVALEHARDTTAPDNKQKAAG
jgi:chromosome segregation ATPase